MLARHWCYAKYFNVISLQSSEQTYGLGTDLVPSFYTCRKQGSERFINLLKVTQPKGRKAEVWTQAHLIPNPVFTHSALLAF